MDFFCCCCFIPFIHWIVNYSKKYSIHNSIKNWIWKHRNIYVNYLQFYSNLASLLFKNQSLCHLYWSVSVSSLLWVNKNKCQSTHFDQNKSNIINVIELIFVVIRNLLIIRVSINFYKNIGLFTQWVSKIASSWSDNNNARV